MELKDLPFCSYGRHLEYLPSSTSLISSNFFNQSMNFSLSCEKENCLVDSVTDRQQVSVMNEMNQHTDSKIRPKNNFDLNQSVAERKTLGVSNAIQDHNLLLDSLQINSTLPLDVTGYGFPKEQKNSANKFRHVMKTNSALNIPYSSTNIMEEKANLKPGQQKFTYYDILNYPKIMNNDNNPLTKKNFIGPEFITMSWKLPNTIQIELPECTNIDSDKKLMKKCNVELLNSYQIEIYYNINSTTASQLLDVLCDIQKLEKRFLYGLAYIQDDEFLFIEPDSKINELIMTDLRQEELHEKYFPCFTMYFRIKFYINISLLRDNTLKQMFYLQLRRDLLSSHIECDVHSALMLGALALQTEFGDYDNDFGQNYFIMDHYLSLNVLNLLGRDYALKELIQLHQSHKGLSPEFAKLEFLKKLQELPSYGYHFHTVFQNKKTIHPVLLGINLDGICIFENFKVTKIFKKIRKYEWKSIKRIFFDENHFFLSPVSENIICHHVKFYTNKDNCFKIFTIFITQNNFIFLFNFQLWAHYLFHMSSSHHFIHRMILCQSFTSKISMKDYFPQRKRKKDKSDKKLKNILRLKTKKESSFIFDNSDLFLPSNRKLLKQNISSMSVSQSGSIKSSVSLDKDSDSVCSKNLFNATQNSESEVPLKTAFVLGTSILSEDNSSLFLRDETLSNTLTERFENLDCILERYLKTITLVKSKVYGFGLEFSCFQDNSVYVQSVFPGGPASVDGTINPGNQLIAINGKQIEGMNFKDVLGIIHSADEVQLTISQVAEKSLERKNDKNQMELEIHNSEYLLSKAPKKEQSSIITSSQEKYNNFSFLCLHETMPSVFIKESTSMNISDIFENSLFRNSNETFDFVTNSTPVKPPRKKRSLSTKVAYKQAKQ